MSWFVGGFRADARRAINATPARRLISLGSMLLIVALAIAFGAFVPWWTWLVVLGLEAILFLYLGDHWARVDAMRRTDDDDR